MNIPIVTWRYVLCPRIGTQPQRIAAEKCAGCSWCDGAGADYVVCTFPEEQAELRRKIEEGR